MGWVADDKRPAGLPASWPAAVQRAGDSTKGKTGYPLLRGILAGKARLLEYECAPGSVRIRTGGDSPRAVESRTRKGNARNG
jgi:hypothetical protein